MSRVTDEEIRTLAQLARLQIAPEEAAGLREDLEGILKHMDALAEVQTDGVDPMTHVLQYWDQEISDGESRERMLSVGRVGHLRDDRVQESLSAERALQASPESRAGCFEVPAILPTKSEK